MEAFFANNNLELSTRLGEVQIADYRRKPALFSNSPPTGSGCLSCEPVPAIG